VAALERGGSSPRGGGPARSSAWAVHAALVGLVALAWAYLIAMGWGMANMDVGIDMWLMPRMANWGATDLMLVFLMWAVMMVAMMLPTALPMVMAMRNLTDTQGGAAPGARVAAFVAGYVVVWTGFSALVTLAQWALLRAHWVTPMMEFRSPVVAGAVLLGAGAFQFSPLKHACLSACRSPISFLLKHWRPGISGAWRMGLVHGLWCTGCCWLLMLLLFVLGVMNVAWIAALTAFVLLEKTWPSNWPLALWISPAAGAAMIGWGVVLVLGGRAGA
jgi:predicted metal-binding membrane protein